MSDIVCISPVDGREVAAARGAQRKWAPVALSERNAKMGAFLAAMQAMNGDIVPELALPMGRPVRYGGEIGSFVERGRALIDISDAALAPYVPSHRPGFTREIKRAPAGLVLVIAPWNYPYLTALNSILPALLSGNAVLLKPATQTLLAGARFQQAFDRIGLPKGLGSVAGGQAIERAAAGTFTTLGLELGGKDPAYVRADADFDYAVANVADGAYYNSGQCCWESSASMSTRRSTTASSTPSPPLRPPTSSAIPSTLRRRWGRWPRRALPHWCATTPPRRSPRALFMNRCDYVDPYLAWSGVKDTGRGAGMSHLGFAAMTRPKSYPLRTNP